MTKTEKLDLIRTTGIIAIMRARSSDQLLAAAEAIHRGGVRVIEVTMTTPGALEVVRAATSRYGDELLFGAGTVIDATSAREAILAGAGFIVAPTLDLPTIALGNRYAIPVVPGIFTPTEALAATEAGAEMVKLFPAEVGGPKMIQALLAPLPQLQIIPVGGVDLLTAGPFIRAGAVALGVGSSLVNQKLLESGDMGELTKRARAFIDAVAAARREES